MRAAYLDSSCLIAVALDEPGSRELIVRLSRYDELFSSNLLEAEFLAALARENVESRVVNLLSWLRWIFPKRRLVPELQQVLEACKPKGADLWHLACALYMKQDRKIQGLSFLTLDRSQSEGAQALGMKGLGPPLAPVPVPR